MESNRREFLVAVSAGGTLGLTQASALSAAPASNFQMPNAQQVGYVQTPNVTGPDPLLGFARRSDIRSRQVGVDLALFDPATGNVHILNPTASLLWQHISPERSLVSIQEMLWLAFAGANLTPDRLTYDLQRAIAELQQRRLIVQKSNAREDKNFRGNITTAITEHSLSKAACGYEAPSIRTMTLGELDKLANLQASFCDVWIIATPHALER